MELKFGNIKMEYDATNSSNRTFMELKFSKSGTTISVTKGSNRTFMELKYWRKCPHWCNLWF